MVETTKGKATRPTRAFSITTRRQRDGVCITSPFLSGRLRRPGPSDGPGRRRRVTGWRWLDRARDRSGHREAGRRAGDTASGVRDDVGVAAAGAARVNRQHALAGRERDREAERGVHRTGDGRSTGGGAGAALDVVVGAGRRDGNRAGARAGAGAGAAEREAAGVGARDGDGGEARRVAGVLADLGASSVRRRQHVRRDGDSDETGADSKSGDAATGGQTEHVATSRKGTGRLQAPSLLEDPHRRKHVTVHPKQICA